MAHHVAIKGAGFLMEKELKFLGQLLQNPQRPFIAILGGAKVSDKIPVIESLLSKADSILIGGAMAYTFFAAQGFGIGHSLVEEDKKDLALNLLEKARSGRVDFQLPEDHVVAASMDPGAEARTIREFPIPPDLMALDIGPRTVEKYGEVIARAKTIFWNGPMGVFEIDRFASGTIKLARAVADSDAVSIVGGGDSVAAVYKAGVQERISHISTGGGASLEYIANETLPGIEALTEK